MRKLLRDPLLHFLLIGGAFFAVSFWRHDGARPDRIVITADEVRQAAQAAALVQGRTPTRAELAKLLEPTIRDEVLYREALALHLDANDDEVRRRLIDKMRYLTEDLADPDPPSEAALRTYYAAEPKRFEIPERVTFRQLYFSPDARGAALETDAAAALKALRTGADPSGLGDKTPLDARYADAPRRQVEVLFGKRIAEALFEMPPGRWAGPYRSDFGLHLIRLDARSPARLPRFEEVREQVRKTYGDDQRAARNAAEYAKMRARYRVVIEWPEAAAAAEGRP